MSPETESLLEQMRDNLGAISPYAVAGAAGAALNEISRLRAENEKLREELEAEKRKTRLHVGATYEPTGERMRAYFPDKRCYQLMLEMAHDLKIAETSGRIVKNVDGTDIEKVNVHEWASKRAKALFRKSSTDQPT